MSAVIIPSPEEYDRLLQQLTDQETNEIEFRVFITSEVYSQIISRLPNPNRHVSIVKIKGDTRTIKEGETVIFQNKQRILDIDLMINRTKLRLSFSREIQEERGPDFNLPDKYFDTIRRRERVTYVEEPFVYTFTKVTTNGKDTFEAEAEFKGPSDPKIGPFNFLRLSKIFTQLVSKNNENVIFTDQLLYLFNRPTNIYHRDIYYLKDDYLVTEKLDGTRTFLCSTPFGTYLTYDPEFFSEEATESLLVLDGEFKEKKFYAFDCLYIRGQNVMDMDGVGNRIQEFKEETDLIKLKVHHPLIPETIPWMHEIIRESEIDGSSVDGLIFTSKQGTYSDTKVLKWKPVNKTTIDFQYIPDGKHFNFYVTMNEGPPERSSFYISGMEEEDIGKILVVEKHGRKLERRYTHGGIPCTEEKVMKMYDGMKCSVRCAGPKLIHYLIRHSYPARFFVPNIPKDFFTIPITEENKNLDHKIVETKFEVTRFVPLRVREDKEQPNKYSVAMDNWQDMIMPIDSRELILGIFSPEMQSYKGLVRSMKYKIYKIVPEGGTVLDIGTGFGGDLNKYEDRKVEKVIAIEPSEHNHQELMRRYGTGKAVGNYTFELEDHLVSMEQYAEQYEEQKVKEKYDTVVAMLSMNFFFNNPKSLEKLFSLIQSSTTGLFVGSFMDSDNLPKLINNGENKYYHITADRLEKGAEVHIRLGDTIVEEQVEYQMSFPEFIAEWESYAKTHDIHGYKIYQIKFDGEFKSGKSGKYDIPEVLKDLYHSYICVVLSKTAISGLQEYEGYPESRDVKSLFAWWPVDSPKYEEKSDRMLDNVHPKITFRLDWYPQEKYHDQVFRCHTLGNNDCFFHAALTDIDEDYRDGDEDYKLQRTFEVRTEELKEYLTPDVWKRSNVYHLIMDCIKGRLGDKYKSYKEEKMFNKAYEEFLNVITQACDVIQGGEEFGAQVGEGMIEILSNFFNRNVYFITTKTHNTQRTPYMPSGVTIDMYRDNRKSIVIAYNPSAGHYEAIGISRGDSKEEIYEFDSRDQFILAIKRYIKFTKGDSGDRILLVPLFAMQEFKLTGIGRVNGDMPFAKTALDSAREMYRGKTNEVLQVLDIYSGLREEIRAKYKAIHPITNAWMKLWEMIITENLLPKDSNTVFCNAELPGNFVYAINCYCNSRNKKLRWFASSLYPEERSSALSDKYGLLRRYPEKWLMNSEHKGDIRMQADINYIEQKILELTHNERVDLYTSDVGQEKKDESDYVNEEQNHLLLHYGQILCGLLTLKNGGNFVVKQFGFTLPETIILIGRVASLFDTCIILKPSTSKPCNSENYLIGKGYHRERAVELIRELKEGHVTEQSTTLHNSIINTSIKLMERQTKIIVGTFPVLEKNSPEEVSFKDFKKVLCNIWKRIFLKKVVPASFSRIQ
jgi:FtsJ-like methyltransferase/mRNA capping enzyme/mRNA capping enzyme, beta chain